MNDKRKAAEEAVKKLKNGMTVGLGSGSTVEWMLKKLGEEVGKGLQITGITTSKKTEHLARKYGIPLTSLSKTTHVDIAIDGADEVDPDLNLLKGGGGALVREKIVASLAEQLIIIVDSSKMVSRLGYAPLPVEVVPFGWEATVRKIEEFGGRPSLRRTDGQVFVSDNGNYILDCRFDQIEQPALFHEKLKQLTGVVDTGLFPAMADQVIISRDGKIETLS
ncbi:ribose-5-phosphate isomerase RpiA [Bacillus sp. Marseille-Q3570]|uniref:ribose-5-phosphate isomerase RpiA n=1 Tax=Bacillus sp. Marseille-Q3570 TaxID=2963522 RepID=UPI0021B74D25|nr:ribose-5-phosphate isomerase RpiA [Bacillus sp. Marseille-Q3570]